ncbi:MAG TPA: tetratricopeptide repeat protein, partial [Patescibacteria group bacterium]|nr:tetratricopeptide repeat protein [Patescibacteria group bacterium]
RALDIRERRLGHENTATAESINGLASELNARGQGAAAEATWNEAIRINCKLLGDSHPAYLWMLNGVIQAQLSQKKYKEAEATAHRCIELEREILGPDHPLIANSLTRLARVLDTQGKTADAKTNLQQALAIWTKRVSNPDPNMGETVSALFDLLLSQRNFDEAKSVFEQVSVDHEKPNTALVVVCANYLARTGHFSDAARRFEDVIQVDPDNHLAYQALASLYVQINDEPSYRRLRSQILNRFGSITNDPRIADRMAKSSFILPCESESLTIATNLANSAVTFDPDAANHPWFQFCKALAEFRAGNFENSKLWIAKVLKPENQGGSRDVEAYMVLAMDEQGLHNEKAAIQALESGNSLARRRLRDLSSGDIDSGWPDWILARSLIKEAQGSVQSNTRETSSVLPVSP